MSSWGNGGVWKSLAQRSLTLCQRHVSAELCPPDPVDLCHHPPLQKATYTERFGAVSQAGWLWQFHSAGCLPCLPVHLSIFLQGHHWAPRGLSGADLRSRSLRCLDAQACSSQSLSSWVPWITSSEPQMWGGVLMLSWGALGKSLPLGILVSSSEKRGLCNVWAWKWRWGVVKICFAGL